MKKLLLITMLLSFSLVGCTTVPSYYKKHHMVMFDSSTLKTLVVVKTKGVIKKTRKIVDIKAIGIPLKNNLILALTHATTIPRYYEIYSPVGSMQVDRIIIDEQYSIDGQSIKKIGSYGDISLFRGNLDYTFPFEFGNSSNIEIGTDVVICGFSYGRTFNTKIGIVAVLEFVSNIVDMFTDPNSREFLVTAPINPGDSGSPVLASHKGNLEVVGIIGAKTIGSEGMGIVYHIDYIKRAIRKILEGNNE